MGPLSGLERVRIIDVFLEEMFENFVGTLDCIGEVSV